jgi:hypothetical protein
MVAQRSSQNRLAVLFERLRISNGWDIETIEKQPKAAPDRKWKDAKQDIIERKIQGILSARQLDDSEYIELADRIRAGKLSKGDRFALERYELQRAYARPVDRQLIQTDDGGRLRKQIEIYRMIFGNPHFAESFFDQLVGVIDSGKPLIKMPVWTLVATIMVVAGLVKGTSLNPAIKIRVEHLDRFKQLLDDNRVMIEDVFKSPLRKDYITNPIRQLNVCLGIVGVKLVPIKKVQQSGRSNVQYKLDISTLKSMNSFLSK